MKEPLRFGSLQVRVLTGRAVYRLIHAHGKYGDEDVKLIGIFSSRALALETSKALRNQPGFRGKKGRFHTMRIVIDQIEWSEGFS